jgi:hypothetical protein
VLEIAPDVVPTAEQLLRTLGAKEVVVEDVDTNVASLFVDEEAPTPEPEPAATPTPTAQP